MDQAKISRFPIWEALTEGEADTKAISAQENVTVSSARRFAIFSPANSRSANSLHRTIVDKIAQALNETGAKANVREKFSFGSLRQLALSIRDADCVYLPVFGSPRLTFGLILHAIFGRFYHKKVVIHLVNQEYSRISIPNKFAIRMFEQLADVILLTMPEGTKRAKYMSVDFLAPVGTDIPASTTALQPRMAMLLDEDSLVVLPILIKAFTVVKQKYPRAELVLLYDAANTEASKEVAGYKQTVGVTLIDLAEWKSFRGGPIAADMIIDFSSFGEDRTALLSAIAEGLPVISFEQPGTKSLLTDGVEGLVISRLDRSFVAGKIIRLIENSETTTTLSREAVRLARRFSPSHLVQHLQDILSTVHA